MYLCIFRGLKCLNINKLQAFIKVMSRKTKNQFKAFCGVFWLSVGNYRSAEKITPYRGNLNIVKKCKIQVFWGLKLVLNKTILSGSAFLVYSINCIII